MVQPPLRIRDFELRDLAVGTPELVDVSGRSTGVTLLRWLGSGGMSTVFVAELDRARRSADLSPETPEKLVVKFVKPAMEHQAERLGIDNSSFFVREAVALGRVMERRPPTEFVVGFYGSGRTNVDIGGRLMALPWLAIELVEAGADGVTLTERVERAGEGLDPVRVLRLLHGIFEGVAVLHGERILHRDLKPDNVLVAGPVDDETPKLADCGIARVEGIEGTVAAMTPAYGGPEQRLSVPHESNPLVGPWTDVHALSAVVWFMIGGEHWCVGDNDASWHLGRRRSLRMAQRVHPAFHDDGALLDGIEAVLARGAAHRLPAAALEGAGTYADRLLPTMRAGDERFASAGELRAALFPLLERCAAAWQRRSSSENRASTAFRSTELGSQSRPPFLVRESSWWEDAGPELGVSRDTIEATTPGSAVFQPDGRVLLRFGERLVYIVGKRPLGVAVPREHRDSVSASRWLVRGPGGGYALVGPRHVLLVRGSFSRMPLPERPGGGEVGEIQAAIGSGGVFGIVTAETDDGNGGPELWTSSDGSSWAPPVLLPLGGDVQALSHGPYGFLVVGSRRNARGRALFLPFDGNALVHVSGVNDGPPLRHAQCGAGRDAWAAGVGFVLMFQRSAVTRESIDVDDSPVAMGLDLVGVPWLVTRWAALRREVDAGVGRWRAHYRRSEARPPLVAIGFTKEEAIVMDSSGDFVHLRTPPPENG